MDFSNIDLFLLISGIIISVFGWVLYKAGVRTVGLLTGLMGGIVLSGIIIFLLYMGNYQINEGLIIIIGIILGGVAGFILINKINNLVFFIIGIIIGVMLWKAFSKVLPEINFAMYNTLNKYYIFDIASGILFGIATLLLQKHIIIIITSFIGSMMIFSSLLPLKDSRYAAFFILIFALSIFVQAGWYKVILDRGND